jgi:hypothetical protein
MAVGCREQPFTSWPFGMEELQERGRDHGLERLRRVGNREDQSVHLNDDPLIGSQQVLTRDWHRRSVEPG